MNRLRLIAQTPDEVSIISAHIQDAILRSADIAYLSDDHIFVMMMNRFAWEMQRKKQRIRSALTLRNVLDVRQKAIVQERRTELLSLLALTFTPAATKPDGIIELVFSGGGVIQLTVDACALILEDVTPAWKARATPQHKHI